MAADIHQFPEHPLSFIRQRLNEARIARCMTMTELSHDVGVTPAAISNYESGDRKPDAATFGKLCQRLKLPSSFFLSERPEVVTDKRTPFFRKFGPRIKFVHSMLERYREWAGEVALYLGRFINFPKAQLPTARVEDTEDMDEELDAIETIARETRRMWGLGNGPIANVIPLLESKGINVVRLQFPELNLENIDAFSCWQSGMPFVFLEEHECPVVRSRFNAMHEVGHLILHQEYEVHQIEDPAVLKKIERQANRFASTFLLPSDTFRAEVYGSGFEHFKQLKLRWRVSMAAMAYRCKELGVFDEEQFIRFRKQLSFHKAVKKEPYDGQWPAERASSFRKALEIILSAKIKTASGVVNDLRLSPEDIAMICDVEPGFLVPEESRAIDLPLRLKSLDYEPDKTMN